MRHHNRVLRQAKEVCTYNLERHVNISSQIRSIPAIKIIKIKKSSQSFDTT